MLDWRERYQAAILETDNTRLKHRIDEAEAAKAARATQVSEGPEFHQLAEAASKLGQLRGERLGDHLAGLPGQPASET
jgi:hypothetical protein